MRATFHALGVQYLAHIYFDDQAFCLQVYERLKGYVGKPIKGCWRYGNRTCWPPQKSQKPARRTVTRWAADLFGSSMKRLSCDLRHVVLAVASLIMLANTFTHPVTQNYDYEVHQETIRANISLRQWGMLPGAGRLEYNPPLYYMIYGRPVVLSSSSYVGNWIRSTFFAYCTSLLSSVLAGSTSSG